MNRVRLFVVIVTVFLLVGFSPSSALAQTDSERVDLEGTKVAIWGEDGNFVESSEIALYAMFEWMNASVEYIYAEDIKSGLLANFDLLAMPGGYMASFSSALDTDGIDNIKEWIANGGSYFGICGGALLMVVNHRFGIYNGTHSLVVPGDYNSAYQIEMDINTTCDGPNLSNMPENMSTLFWGSSYFIPDEGLDYIPIAHYTDNGGLGMIALEHGQGNVFLSSPHPEYEEGSSRDNTTEFDEYPDPDSEWDFLLQIAIWQIESSLPDTGSRDIVTIGVAVVSIAAVVVVVAIFLKKR